MTTLAPGDIAVIGYASSSAGALPKSFAVVVLRAIDAGTVLNFTDDGWFSGGGFRAGEGILTYTAPTGGAVAGTVITFNNQTGTFNLATAGDQITVFQGAETPAATAHATGAVPLFALDYATSNASFTEATNSNTTALPAGLSAGSTAVAFNGLNGTYVGPTSGTAAALLAAIDNAANWTFSASSPAAYATSFSVTATSNGSSNVSIGDASISEGDSGVQVLTFTVTRSDPSGAFDVNFATADGTATAGSDYLAAAGLLHFTAGGAATQTVSVTINGDVTPEPNETFTVTLSGVVNTTGVATLTRPVATGTIVNDDFAIVGIADIQGAAQVSPYANQSVTTQGVVTAVSTSGSRGFYIQDSSTGGPAGASHGLFVFTNAAPTVAVGDTVQVRGVVTEYNAGNANNLPITEINGPTVTVLGHGATVTPVVIGQGGLLPPTSVISGSTYDPAHNGIDFYESLEGQLVTIHNAQAVDATFSNSTWVVADFGASATGINSRGGITVGATDFNPERIQVFSSALSATMGQHLGDITGVITYFNGEYELIPTQPITVSAPPAAARETTTLRGDATHLSVGAYNVSNLGPVQPGVAQADVDARFAQLGVDIAVNLGAPDILGLEEIQDADGQGSGADLSGAATLNKLIAAIAAAGGPTYRYVEIAPTVAGSTGGAPGGNIRVAYIYNPSRVNYVPGSAQLIADPNLADGDAFTNSRQPLAAQWSFNGQIVTTIDVHNYARSGSEELFGLDQPPINSGDQRRIDQTAAVQAYVAQIEAQNPNALITVAGDFNGFQFETTLTQLSQNGLLTNLTNLLDPTDRYSSTFGGNSEQIDQFLVSPQFTRSGAQFDIVHINTGQGAANRTSDHDPVLSLLAIAQPARPVQGPSSVSVGGQAVAIGNGQPATSVQAAANAANALLGLTGGAAPPATLTAADGTISVNPVAAQAQAAAAIIGQFASGSLSAPDAANQLLHLADGTTSVAEISYAFFTGRTPSAAGLAYLTQSSANPTDLNDPYYARFTTENRYINFAVNLATGAGAGAQAFQASYGALSLSDATTRAYQAVFGFAAPAGRIDAILNSLVSNGRGGLETRAQYFAEYGGDGPNGLGTKAAAIGFLLADSVREGFGAYSQADQHFLVDLAHGQAVYGVDLLATYGGVQPVGVSGTALFG